MAYIPHNWKDGELLRAEDLNHLERGVMNEQIGPEGKQGPPGEPGKGAYEIAVENGFSGTQAEWLESLVGPPGPQGEPGRDGAPGDPGIGVPPGGLDGQLLARSSDSENGTKWVDPPQGGGSSGSGVTSFKGRTGAVMPQTDDYTAAQISFSAVDAGMTAKNMQSAIEELFTSVSEGKSLIASAITDKGVETAAGASFQQMRENILSIETGGGLPEDVYTISVTADPPEGGTVTGGGYASAGMTATARAGATGSYVFDHWSENGKSVSEEPSYSFPVNGNRDLTASFVFFEYVAGVNWWASSLPSASRWQRVAYGDGTFVAITDATRAAYSTDGGKTWEESTLPSSSGWQSVAYGDGTFVALSYNNNKAAYSTDGGKTWAQSTLPSSAYWRGIAYGDGVFVAVAGGSNASGGSNKAVYSTDGGKTWTASTLPSSANWWSVAYGGGVFVAPTYGGARGAYSTDGGKTWTQSVFPSGAYCQSVAYGGGVFVAPSYNSNKVSYSMDGGKTWEEATLPSSANWRGVTYGDGMFVTVAYDDSKAAYSTDGGKTWEESALPSSSMWYSAAYGGGIFVAVAYSGQVAYSFTGNAPPT